MTGFGQIEVAKSWSPFMMVGGRVASQWEVGCERLIEAPKRSRVFAISGALYDPDGSGLDIDHVNLLLRSSRTGRPPKARTPQKLAIGRR